MSDISHEGLRQAIFAGGCFWCVEADFKKRPAIKDIESGYIGGETEEPSYETAAKEGHREAVRIWYDPEKTSYKELVAYFFTIHDPTDTGGSFNDRGHTYTSAIYYQNDEQKSVAEDVKKILAEKNIFQAPITTEILPAENFWLAEEYHQNYAEKSASRYKPYRRASGRDKFISEHRDKVYQALGI